MATGNPRNKVALKPGFSLIGWIRLTNSGEDLAKRKGAISYDELRKHDKVDDCWIAIRGKVFNITRYADFHPGGVEQLMRGAGKDATSLFDEVHAWVNFEQLLAKCYIGPLKNIVMLDLSNINETSSKKSLTNLSPNSAMSSLLPPIKESLTQVPAQINPRFDWIQKRSDLTLYFYLKSFCNPGVVIEQTCDRECIVTIFIGSDIYNYKFSFYKTLKWPPTLKVNQEKGKLEIIFEKEESDLWSSYGMFEKINTDGNIFCEFTIIEKKLINHDSYQIILNPKTNKFIHFISLGHHVDLKLSINGKDIMRSYTPIPAKYVSFDNSAADINFLIKKYDSGSMSKHIFESGNDNILVSHQLGSFELSKLNAHSNIAFLAAGSGITPFCGLLEHLLARNANRIQSVILYDFNKTEQDIWFRDIFNEMADKDKRFKVIYVLSEPDDSWTGEKGKISEKVLDELVKLDMTTALICGPVSFNAEALRIINASSKIDTMCFQA